MRITVDTNILFEGLTRLGPCSRIVDAWVARKFVACVSTTLALEYEAVLGTKLARDKRRYALGALAALLDRAEYIPVTIRLRPHRQ